MITRGYYIGEIIDHFSSISQQIEMRNRLGFTDLSVYVEAHFRDVLNAVLKFDLESLNSTRSNEPGVDLGDAKKGVAIQVTSRSDAKKILDTLTKLTDEQTKKYKKFVVFVVGQKQGSYTLTDPLYAKYQFDVQNIWDLTDIARDVVSLKIEALEIVHRLVRRESARLLAELEIPNEQGEYALNNYDKWELPAQLRVSDGSNFIAYLLSNGLEVPPEQPEAISNALADFGSRLTRLPRITREFLAMLYENRHPDRSGSYLTSDARLPLGFVKRAYRGNDLQGELDLLIYAGFIDIDESRDERSFDEIVLCIPGHSSFLQDGFLDYMHVKQLSFRKVFGEADLSCF